MGTNFLIDTNTVIDYFNDILPAGGTDFMDELVEGSPQISVITEIETLGFNGSPAEMTLVSEFVKIANVLELNRATVNQTILLRKSHKIKLPDAIIAATALVHGLTLITRNTSDFSKIAGLKIIDPHLL